MTGREMGREEWRREAALLEGDGLFARAALYYSHGGDEKSAARCSARSRFAGGDFREAVYDLLDLEEYDLAASCAAKLAPDAFGDLQYITGVLTGKARLRLGKSEILLRFLQRSRSAETAARVDEYLARALEAAAANLEAAAGAVPAALDPDAAGTGAGQLQDRPARQSEPKEEA